MSNYSAISWREQVTFDELMVMSLCTRSTLIWIFMVLTHRYHNTSSVTYMLQTLTWPTLQQRRLKTKLIMFYKIVHHIVAVLTTILIPTDPRIRQFHPFTYRHLHAFKYPYKYSFFPNTIIDWNLLPQTIVLCPTVNTFREHLTPTVLSHQQSQI
jgi:hypothetical protein